MLYRLNLISVHLPALRERSSDIPELAQHFLKNAGKIYGRDKIKISDAAMKWLQSRPFPGNIRELKHLIERAVIMTSENILNVEDFTMALNMEQGRKKNPGGDPLPEVGSMSIEEMEKAMIIKAIEHHGGNITRIADDLGLSRFALYRRLEKYGLKI